MNRTDKTGLFSVGLSQQTRYYGSNSGYWRGTGNKYGTCTGKIWVWKCFPRNGLSVLAKYCLSVTVSTGLLRACHYWVACTGAVLTSQYWARSDFHNRRGTTPVLPVRTRYWRTVLHLYWRNTGVIMLHQYWLSSTD